MPEVEADKTVSLGTRGVAASYLVAPADGVDEDIADDTTEIELMADGTKREGT